MRCDAQWIVRYAEYSAVDCGKTTQGTVTPLTIVDNGAECGPIGTQIVSVAAELRPGDEYKVTRCIQSDYEDPL